MADINVKLLQGAEDKMLGDQAPEITNGQLYFATIDNEGKGYIYLDSNEQRFSFGKYAIQATNDGGGNEIFSTYINGLSVSNLDFTNANSQDNLYLRAYIPSGKILPNTDAEKPNYIIPAANADTPGLLSLTAQTIYGEKTFQNLSHFVEGLSVDNNSNFSVSTAPDSLIQDSNFNIALNGNSNGILFTSSNATNNGFIQYNYSSSIEELIIGINNDPENNFDRVIIQSSGEDSLLHYNDCTQTYSTIFDTENFQSLQISISGSTTDYNENVIDFNFNGSQSINIHAGNAYQDMTNTVEDSSTPTSGINASTLGGHSYLDIAAEMLLSDDEVAELIE